LRQNVTEGEGGQFYPKLRDVIYRGALQVLCIRQVLARQLLYNQSANAFTDHPDGVRRSPASNTPPVRESATKLQVISNHNAA